MEELTNVSSKSLRSNQAATGKANIPKLETELVNKEFSASKLGIVNPGEKEHAISIEKQNLLTTKKSDWSCLLKPSELNRPVKSENYVGALFNLDCRTDAANFIPWEGKIKFIFDDENHNYSLYPQALKFSKKSHFVVEVAAYRAGEHPGIPFTIVDDHGHLLSVTSGPYHIASVLPPAPPPKEYGSYGPFDIQYPQWLFYGLGATILIVVLFGFLRLKKILDRKKIIKGLLRYGNQSSEAAGLQNHGDANFAETKKRLKQNAHQYFHKELRGHLRKYDSLLHAKTKSSTREQEQQFLNALDHSLRLFLVRYLMVPALDWNSKDIISEIRSRHKTVYRNEGKQLRMLLNEFESAIKRQEGMSREDCTQFVVMTRRTIDSFFKAKHGERK